ncbi:ankyrin repeat protein, putative [Trichomonas vaginalis G3]|uniref:Ankyrin repeat protein, putative n=1 Tax=Trichomonas vaginalis (strain ATCC PRA-98 / G3) TaxID=412133 RepID=A2H7U4_TRIV3|nr:ankyrin repeat protein, putative [Trichomonas vaginalis G3]|eukprot:XP_001287453.1 ankyrin repeat protein [Trichomonas vaginalis G3]
MQITPTYLNFSFLSGVPEIMGECLKYQTPNDESMFFVIVSHNTDFLTFLINQYHLEMNLSYCAAFGNLNAFLIYFDMTKDVNDCFINSPLFYLPSLVEDFISFGVDINASDLLGKTAIIHAGLTNNRSAEILLSHGADINSRDSDGMTALHKAASNNYVEFMEFLIEHGADYNASDICKYSVLHFTTRYDSKDAAALLISYGANINAVDDTGKSTLLNAAQQDDFAIAELLISHGADIMQRL